MEGTAQVKQSEVKHLKIISALKELEHHVRLLAILRERICNGEKPVSPEKEVAVPEAQTMLQFLDTAPDRITKTCQDIGSIRSDINEMLF